MLVGEALQKSCSRNADKVAAKFENEEITYRELEDKTNQLANGLIDLDVQIGDMVGVLLHNSIDFLTSYFGVMKSGATMVPINIMFKQKALEYILNNSQAKVLITSRDFLPLIKSCKFKYLEEIILVEDERVEGYRNLIDFFAGDKSYPKVEGLNQDSIAACLYTSGTTGDPKGALLTHGNLIFDTKATKERLQADETGRYLCILPMFHSFAEILCLLMPIYLGATIVIAKRFLPQASLATIQEEKISCLAAVPTMFTAMLNVKNKEEYDLSSLELSISGGAAMPLKILEEFEETFNAIILEGYGLTETSPVSFVNPVDGVRKPGSIGLALSGVKAKIVDEYNNELSYEEVGELAIQGDHVMKAYFKKPEATNKALKNEWLHTGDMARMDEDGYVYIVDRKKDMINVSGMNVYPREIEEQLYQYHKVLEVAVVAAEDKLRGEVPKAYVVLKENETASAREIKLYCMNYFANYKVPKFVEFVNELPKNATGKIDKKILKAM